MTDTEALIRSLAANVVPVSRYDLARRIAIGLVGGGLATALLVATLLGIRPDLDVAMRGSAFWIKWAYTLSMAAIAIVMTARVARPDHDVHGLWWLLAPMAALAVLGAFELMRTPRHEWSALLLGQTWSKCPGLVFALSLPMFAGLLWSFRCLAPVRLRTAGATAGFTSGACAATLYCLHCPEVSVVFVLTWYTLGILLITLVGGWVGPRVLRW